MEFKIGRETITQHDEVEVLRRVYAPAVKASQAAGRRVIQLSPLAVAHALDRSHHHLQRDHVFDEADFVSIFGRGVAQPRTHAFFIASQRLFTRAEAATQPSSSSAVDAAVVAPPVPAPAPAIEAHPVEQASSQSVPSSPVVENEHPLEFPFFSFDENLRERLLRPFLLSGTNIEFADIWRYSARGGQDFTSQLSVRWGMNAWSRLSGRFTLSDSIEEFLRGQSRAPHITAAHAEVAVGSRLVSGSFSLGMSLREFISNVGLRLQFSAMSTIRPVLHRNVVPFHAARAEGPLLADLKENLPILGGIRTRAQQIRYEDLKEIHRLLIQDGIEPAVAHLRNLFPYIPEQRARNMLLSPTRGFYSFVLELASTLILGEVLDRILPDGEFKAFKNAIEASVAFLPAAFIRSGIRTVPLARFLSISAEAIPLSIIQLGVTEFLDAVENRLGFHIPHRRDLIDPLLSLALYYRIKISVLQYLNSGQPPSDPPSAAAVNTSFSAAPAQSENRPTLISSMLEFAREAVQTSHTSVTRIVPLVSAGLLLRQVARPLLQNLAPLVPVIIRSAEALPAASLMIFINPQLIRSEDEQHLPLS